MRPNERLSKQSWGWWFETLSRSLWRHRNDVHGHIYTSPKSQWLTNLADIFWNAFHRNKTRTNIPEITSAQGHFWVQLSPWHTVSYDHTSVSWSYLISAAYYCLTAMIEIKFDIYAYILAVHFYTLTMLQWVRTTVWQMQAVSVILWLSSGLLRHDYWVMVMLSYHCYKWSVLLCRELYCPVIVSWYGDFMVE